MFLAPGAGLFQDQSSLLTLPDGLRTVLGEYRAGPYQIGPVGAVTAGYQELPVYRDGQTWDAQNGQRYPQPDGTILGHVRPASSTSGPSRRGTPWTSPPR